MQLLDLNEEFLVSAVHQIALITSLPFVHTARRYYRLNGLVRPSDWRMLLATANVCREVGQTWSFRGSKSRNKVSVGEPADGSLTFFGKSKIHIYINILIIIIIIITTTYIIERGEKKKGRQKKNKQQQYNNNIIDNIYYQLYINISYIKNIYIYTLVVNIGNVF